MIIRITIERLNFYKIIKDVRTSQKLHSTAATNSQELKLA